MRRGSERGETVNEYVFLIDRHHTRIVREYFCYNLIKILKVNAKERKRWDVLVVDAIGRWWR